MNFQITEDEYNTMESVMCQLNMMADMCLAVKGLETPCSPDDLGQFLTAQVSSLGNLRRSMNDRHELTTEGPSGMAWFDWVHALTIAGVGYNGVPRDAKDKIDDALSHMAQVDPDYDRVLKTWVDISKVRSIEQGWRRVKADGWATTVEASAQPQEDVRPSGNLSVTLFADLMRAVSGQAMELDKLNETVSQFMAAFHEEHYELTVIRKALNNALMHNGYEWVLTCGQDGQRDQWVRKVEATTPAPTVGKQRKRERTAKKAKGTATMHMASGAGA